MLITVRTDICLDCWLWLVTKRTNKYTHPIKKHLFTFFYCRETYINPNKPVSKCSAMTVQMLSQKAPSSYTVSYIRETQQVAWRKCIFFLTLQQCEKTWHMYSCVYRDLLSSAMRWEITVASWKQVRKENSINTAFQNNFFTVYCLKEHSQSST